jgi:hypothetical protein
MDEIHLWQWRFTDEFGKRRVTSWRMTENTVREFAHVYKDAEKVEGSLEIRKLIGRTSDWLHSLPPSESTAASGPPGSSSDSGSSKA